VSGFSRTVIGFSRTVIGFSRTVIGNSRTVSGSGRTVIPELLDELPPHDPRAVHSRSDLRRVNKLMGNADIAARAILRNPGWLRPHLVELGGGDGTFLLEIAKRVAPVIGAARVTIVDRQALVTPATREALAARSWAAEPVQADVFEWLSAARGMADITLANLFLHHFKDGPLTTLLAETARQTKMFVACEPHRSAMALTAASLMGAIGCNSVTVHDARISVRAGFREHELSALWPVDAGWVLQEGKAGRFTHGFVARRGDVRG
jgi:hypothetical protein